MFHLIIVRFGGSIYTVLPSEGVLRGIGYKFLVERDEVTCQRTNGSCTISNFEDLDLRRVSERACNEEPVLSVC